MPNARNAFSLLTTTVLAGSIAHAAGLLPEAAAKAGKACGGGRYPVLYEGRKSRARTGTPEEGGSATESQDANVTTKGGACSAPARAPARSPTHHLALGRPRLRGGRLSRRDYPPTTPDTVQEQTGRYIIPTNAPPGDYQFEISFSARYPPSYDTWEALEGRVHVRVRPGRARGNGA